MAFTIKMPACFINGAQLVSFESYFLGFFSFFFASVLHTFSGFNRFYQLECHVTEFSILLHYSLKSQYRNKLTAG